MKLTKNDRQIGFYRSVLCVARIGHISLWII